MDRMWLVGMMGSGKSTIGRDLAQRLGVTFHDTDDLVGQRAGMSIAELFETIGVVAFRDLERQAVESVSTATGVIATGGGVVLDEDLRRLMAETGLVVHLAAPAEVLASRVGTGQGRPLIAEGDTAERLRAIAETRASLYHSVADIVIETAGMAPSDVVDELERSWNES